MNAYARRIREIAQRLLSDKAVDMVVGYRAGTVALRARPFVARTPAEAGELTWSGFCVGNLARLAAGLSGRVAVCAQGCVSRNLVGIVRENRLSREDLTVIAVPCLGMLDARKIAAKVGGRAVTGVREEGEEVTVTGAEFEEVFSRGEVKRDNCLTCLHRNPVLADEVVADPVPETGGGDADKVIELWERKKPEARFELFARTFRDCIRCYACRDVCPLCHCAACFVDRSRPQWVGKTQDEPDVLTYHLLRAFHCAGRCTDCGACESACPVGIPMRRLTSKLESDARRLFGHEAFLSLDAKPALAVFSPDDPDEVFS
jgi:ferredoxin